MIVEERRRVLFVLGDVLLVVAVGLVIRTLLFPNLPLMKIAHSTAIFPVAFYITGFYERRRLTVDGMYLAQAATAGAMILAAVAVISYLVPSAALPRRFPILGIGSVLILLPLWRVLATSLIGRVNQKIRIIIHGSGSAAEALSEVVSAHDDFVLEDATEAVNGNGSAAPALVADLSLTSSQEDSEALLKLLRRGHHVIDMVNLYERVTGRLPTEHLTHQWLLSELQPVRGPAYGRIERARDVVGSIVLLLLLFVPAAIAAFLIWVNDRGPVFFRQQRIGIDEREFTIIKLRTMKEGSDQNGPLWTVQDDDRITRVGRIVRWLRLDEVPQLLNVLKGEMSLVGPRPEAKGLVETYETEIPNYHLRHLVKPGITGWAQVCFENTSSVEAVRKKLEYDLYYIRHRGLVFDLRIMLRTIGVVLSGMGSR